MVALDGCIRTAGSNCRDRAAWFRRGNRLVVAVADGDSDQADSGHAAEFAIHAALKFALRESSPLEPAQWVKLVADVDEPLSLEPSGETTLVVVDIGPSRVTGASVGHSRLFQARENTLLDVTAGQSQKPLLGSGAAVVRGFEAEWTAGNLLVCSDGLHKYAAKDRLADALPRLNAAALLEMARLPDGRLFDDAAAIIVGREAGRTALPEGVVTFIEPQS